MVTLIFHYSEHPLPLLLYITLGQIVLQYLNRHWQPITPFQSGKGPARGLATVRQQPAPIILVTSPSTVCADRPSQRIHAALALESNTAAETRNQEKAGTPWNKEKWTGPARKLIWIEISQSNVFFLPAPKALNLEKGVMEKGHSARLKESRYRVTLILVLLFPLCKRLGRDALMFWITMTS